MCEKLKDDEPPFLRVSSGLAHSFYNLGGSFQAENGEEETSSAKMTRSYPSNLVLSVYVDWKPDKTMESGREGKEWFWTKTPSK